MMSKVLVPMIVLSNIVFAGIILVMFWYRGQEPMALIGAWFAFTTGELWAMAIIQREKVKTEGVKHYEDYHSKSQVYRQPEQTHENR